MNGGKFELEFVGAALVARVYLVTGHPGDSVKTLEEIETRAQQRGARRVVPAAWCGTCGPCRAGSSSGRAG